MTDKDLVERELAVRAYSKGYAIGADPLSSAKRQVVDPATHAHWLEGFDAGRRAIDEATAAYRAKLKVG